MKMNTILDRVLEIANSEGITITSLEKKIGASAGVLSRAIRNNTDIQTKWVQNVIENYPLYDANWLLTGKGNMLKDKKEYLLEDSNIIKISERPMSVYTLTKDYYSQDKQLIPLYDLSAAAGLNTLFSDQSSQIPLDYISVPNAPKCDGALSIRGDSMYPILKSGDIACYKIIRSFEDVRFGEMYILDIEDSSDQYLTAKYVQRSEKGDKYLKLVSENKYHAEKDQHKSNIRALALIKMYIRMNTIS